MNQPRIFAKKATFVELEPGSYRWCACGSSATQPFCDGSHQGTGIVPVEFTMAGAKRVALCLCKHTKRPPFCDGAHSKL